MHRLILPITILFSALACTPAESPRTPTQPNRDATPGTPDPVSAKLESIAITASAQTVTAGAQLTLTAEGLYSDGAKKDVTSEAQWTSTATAVATVSATGVVSGVASGSTKIEAKLDGESASVELTVPCTYPAGTGAIRVGSLMPKLSWTGAMTAAGATADFDLESFHCAAEYSGFKSLIFIIGAGWCPNCPEYMRAVQQVRSELDTAGAMVVWVEIETNDNRPARHTDAHSIVEREVPGAEGLRIGDGETMPTAGAFAAVAEFVPTAYVVRRRDMKVIADQASSQAYLPFVDIAKDPEADWSSPPSLPAPPFQANCGPDDEETYEPNDSPADAGALSAGADFTGGICAEAPDFYVVEHDGAWRLDLEFTHAEGDLDLYLWDTAANRPVLDSAGAPIGSETTDDNEAFEHTGTSTVIVLGYQGGSAKYRLKVTGI